MPDASQAVNGLFVVQVAQFRGEACGHREGAAPAMRNTNTFKVGEEKMNVLFQMTPGFFAAVGVQVVGECEPNGATAHDQAAVGGDAVIVNQVAGVFNPLLAFPTDGSELLPG